APRAGAAEVVALDRHPIAGDDALNAGTHLLHGPAPLVAGDDRILDVGPRPRPLHHFHVAHADSGKGHLDQDLALARLRIGLIAEERAVRRADDDRLHGTSLTSR